MVGTSVRSSNFLAACPQAGAKTGHIDVRFAPSPIEGTGRYDEQSCLTHHHHMQPHTEPRMLKADEVARCLGLTRSTVYDWIARGSMPSHRFGRTIRVSSDDLKAYLTRTRMNDFATERELGAGGATGLSPSHWLSGTLFVNV